MKLLALISLSLWSCAWGAVSVILPSGKTGTISFGGFTNAQSWRMEGRIHSRTPFAAQLYGIQLNGSNGFHVSLTGAPIGRVSCTIQNVLHTTAADAPADFEFRMQRIVTTPGVAGEWRCEIWDIAASNTPIVGPSSTSGTLTPGAITAGTFTVGGTNVNMSIAYLRIFTDAAAPMPLGSLPPSASTTLGNYADYPFEGTTAAELGADVSGNGRNLCWSGGSCPTTSGPAPATETTPALAPVCNAGVTKVFRAGDTIQADGTGSWSRSQLPLTFAWNVLQEPAGSQVRYLNNNSRLSSSLGLENIIAGEYVLSLSVSDGISTTTCTVAHGVVPATTSGVVIPDISTPEKVKFHELLGPVLAYYKFQQTWPYAAYVGTYMEQFFRTQTGPQWDTAPVFFENPAYWKAGTITLTPGSAIVTGTGTSLQTLICNGGTTVNPAGGTARQIVFRYPSSEGGYNWNALFIASCQSETQVTASATYTPRSDSSGVHSGLNFYTENNYMTEVPSSNWSGTGAGFSSANFYDLALAYYAYHHATGLTAPLNRARGITEAWIKSPYGGIRGFGSRYPRDMALSGAAMRYLEDTAANSWMLTALRHQADYLIKGYVIPVGEREEFYATLFIAECNYLNGPNCSNTVTNGRIDTWWKPYQCTNGTLHSWGRDCLNNWGQFTISSVRGQDASWIDESPDAPYEGSTVSVNNGSRRVTLSGATWPSDYWNFSQTNIRAFWFKPDNNTLTNDYPYSWTNSQVSGTQGTFTPISSTQFDLPTPWPGPNISGSAWQYAQFTGQYATQPFITGIGGYTLWRQYRTTGYADALTMSQDQANFIMGYGYNPTQKGMYYMRGALNCETVTGGPSDGCANSQSTARFLNGETLRTMAYAYMATGNATYKTYGDKFVGAIFGDPSCDPNCGPETDAAGNDDIKPPNGYTYSTQRAKDFGFLFGMGGLLTYAAIRTGMTAWPMTPVSATVQVSFRLADIPGADRIAITLKDQRGIVGTPTICLTSPCAVTIPDRSAGNYQMMITYRTGATNRASGIWQQFRNVE